MMKYKLKKLFAFLMTVVMLFSNMGSAFADGNEGGNTNDGSAGTFNGTNSDNAEAVSTDFEATVRFTDAFGNVLSQRPDIGETPLRLFVRISVGEGTDEKVYDAISPEPLSINSGVTNVSIPYNSFKLTTNDVSTLDAEESVNKKTVLMLLTTVADITSVASNTNGNYGAATSEVTSIPFSSTMNGKYTAQTLNESDTTLSFKANYTYSTTLTFSGVSVPNLTGKYIVYAVLKKDQTEYYAYSSEINAQSFSSPLELQFLSNDYPYDPILIDDTCSVIELGLVKAESTWAVKQRNQEYTKGLIFSNNQILEKYTVTTSFHPGTITLTPSPNYQYKVVMQGTGTPTESYKIVLKIAASNNDFRYYIGELDFENPDPVTVSQFVDNNNSNPQEYVYSGSAPTIYLTQSSTPLDAESSAKIGIDDTFNHGLFKIDSIVPDPTHPNLSIITINAFESYPITLKFYDIDGELADGTSSGTEMAFHKMDGAPENEKYYIRAYVHDKTSGEILGYTLMPVDPTGKTSMQLGIATFTDTSADSMNQQGHTFNYDPSLHTLETTNSKGEVIPDIRFVTDDGTLNLSNSPSYATVSSDAVTNSKPYGWEGFANLWNDSSNHGSGNTISIRKSKDKLYAIKIVVDPDMENLGSTMPLNITDADNIWVTVEADHGSTGKGYFISKLSDLSNDGATIVVDKWYAWNGNERTGDTYTDSETATYTVRLVKPKVGQSIESIENAFDFNNKVNEISIGDEVKVYEFTAKDENDKRFNIKIMEVLK